MNKPMNRKEELSQWPYIRFPIPIKESDLEAAYQKGMLSKEQLVDGHYYLGYCRNAYVAKWDSSEKTFCYMRTKWKDIYPEKIFHPEDDNGYDLFIPYKKVEPTEEERIKKPQIYSFVLYRKQE
jgi:hypothetical protein